MGLTSVESPPPEGSESNAGRLGSSVISDPLEQLSFVKAYAAECNSETPPAVVDLKTLSTVLHEATKMEICKGEQTSQLDALCRFLPAAIKRTIDTDIAPSLFRNSVFQTYLYEVLSALVQLAAATFSCAIEGLSAVAIESEYIIPRLLEALEVALNSTREMYKLRQRKGMREILVCSGRLESVLQFPGLPVKAINGQAQYFCSQKGVKNWSVGVCTCCAQLPLWADPLLASLTSLLATTASGIEYPFLLRWLRSPEKFPLPTIALLLRPLCRLLKSDGTSNTRKEEIARLCLMKASTKIVLLNVIRISCPKLFHYLDKLVPVNSIEQCPKLDFIEENHQVFSAVLGHLHTITSWGVKVYGREEKTTELVVDRDSLGKLQEKMWERFIEAEMFSSACESIGAALEASLTPTCGDDSLVSLKWLEDKKIIFLLLRNAQRTMEGIPHVIQLLATVAKKKLVLQEKDFLDVLTSEVPRSDGLSMDQVSATMLEVLDISAYSDGFLDEVLKWLESRQADSIIHGWRTFFVNVLSKLLANDKQRRWEKRFFTLISKHWAGISDSDLVVFLTKVADHYASTYHGVEDTFMQNGDKQAKLLQACSSADMLTCISSDMGDINAFDHTKVYGKKAEYWESQEIDLHTATSSKLAKALAIDFPMARHEAAKKCLERLVLARHLSYGLHTDDPDSLASVRATAMSAELQILEGLEKESSLHCNVIRQVEELNQRHLQAYESLRQEQHERLQEFLKACCKEKEDVVWEALYQKAKVLAYFKRATLSRDEELSSEEILQRILQKAGVAIEEVTVALKMEEGKHKESLQRLLNSECSVCFSKFSSKRKRACFDPCGHASACVACSTEAFKRKKTCPLCITGIQEIIQIPHNLYF